MSQPTAYRQYVSFPYFMAVVSAVARLKTVLQAVPVTGSAITVTIHIT